MMVLIRSFVMRRALLNLALPSSFLLATSEVWMATIIKLPLLSLVMIGAPLCPPFVEIVCLSSDFSLMISMTLPGFDRPHCLASNSVANQLVGKQVSPGYPNMERVIQLVTLLMSPLRGMKFSVGTFSFSFRRAQSLLMMGWRIYFPGRKTSSTSYPFYRGPDAPGKNLKLEQHWLVLFRSRLWAAVRTTSYEMRMPVPFPTSFANLVLKVMAPMWLWGGREISPLTSKSLSFSNIASSRQTSSSISCYQLMRETSTESTYSRQNQQQNGSLINLLYQHPAVYIRAKAHTHHRDTEESGRRQGAPQAMGDLLLKHCRDGEAARVWRKVPGC